MQCAANRMCGCARRWGGMLAVAVAVWLMQGRGSLVKCGATSEKGSSQAGPCRDDETKGRPESPPRERTCSR